MNIKHPNLDMTIETVKTLVDKLNTIYKEEKNITFERLLLFSREQKHNESLEVFYNSLSELAKTCDLGTLESSLVKDLFLAKMNNKELQLKFCREKTAIDDVLKEVILYERGVQSTNSFQKVTSQHQNVQIKQEPTFSIESKRGRRFQRGNASQRGGVGKSKFKKNDTCRKCGGRWPHVDQDCPAKGKECRLCKRIGHFEKFCQNARPKVGSIENEQNASFTSQSSSATQGSQHQSDISRSSSTDQSSSAQPPKQTLSIQTQDCQFFGNFEKDKNGD